MYLKDFCKEKCTGCSACKNICPKGAITMKEDEEGFLYPEINEELCINCNLCVNVCPIEEYTENRSIKAFAVKHVLEDERLNSQSGALFAAISDFFLEQNGCIYGAKIDDEFKVYHDKAIDKFQRDKLRGSKYIQSDMKDVIKNIKKDLKENKKVLFTGTGCQVAGVINALKHINLDNLYTCDVVCHGVPSPKVFADFIKCMEDLYQKKISKFKFRDKKYGWSSHYTTITFKDGTEIKTDLFKNLFLRNNILRPSCYECNFSNINRPSDITMSDFWGVDEVLPEMYDKTGVSLTLINTEKGKELFNEIKENLIYKECEISNAIKRNPNLSNPSSMPKTREEFWRDYFSENFEYIIDKYAK